MEVSPGNPFFGGWDSRLVIVNGKIVFILDKGTGNKIDEIKWEPIADVFLLPNGDHIILISKNGDMISFSQSSGEQKEFDLPVRGLVKHTISYSGPTSKEPFEPLPAPGQTQPQTIFDPETSERISGGMRFDPETGEAIIENIKTQFDPETGEQIVVAEEKQKMSFGDFCILPFADGTLTGINIKNGSLEWQIETGKPITGFWRVGKGFIPSGMPQILFKKKVIRAASFTGVVSFAGLAWYFQSKADQHFDNYLHSGDPNEMSSEWNRTQELDKMSGWMVVLSQVCSQILILTYVEHE